MSKELIIKDPVHGLIEIDPLRAELINTPEFQRLNFVSQNGLAKLVYPGANHTRLEHSLGTSHLAGQVAIKLKLSKEDEKLITSAALLHDIGHGPFSHCLDHAMEKTHEEIGSEIIQGRVKISEEENRIPSILEKHSVSAQEVIKIIQGKHEKKYLNQIISGHVDVDRLDYLERDALHAGVTNFVDNQRIVSTMMLKGDEIVFKEKGIDALEGFLVGRNLMYNSLYRHHTSIIAGQMLKKAVKKHESELKGFHLWTDGELLHKLGQCEGLGKETVQRITQRRLYKRAFEIKNTNAKDYDLGQIKEKIKTEDALEKQITNLTRINSDNFVVSVQAQQMKSIARPVNIKLITNTGKEVQLSEASPIISALAEKIDFPHILAVYSPPEHVEKIKKAMQEITPLK